MKIIIVFLISIISLSAQPFEILFGNGAITYDGSELLTNEIDRTLEPTSAYTSDFTVNQDGWSNIWGTVSGNNDGIYGEDDVAKTTANGSGAYSYKSTAPIVVGDRFTVTISYYVSSGTSCSRFVCILGTTSPYAINALPPTYDSWTIARGSGIPKNATQVRAFFQNSAEGDSLYFKDVLVSKVSNFLPNGNHSVDTTSTQKQADSYSLDITASAAGDGTTNTVSLDSDEFTAVTDGANYRFQVYAYTETASTTLTFELGDISQSLDVSTSGFTELNFDFEATASTTGDIKLYLNKAATVYIDAVSLKSGR